MKISLNSERITFQKNTTVVDENANHMSSWEDYFTCWAYVNSGNYGNETLAAGTTAPASGLVFSVRYCSELASLDTVHYRVLFKNQTYDIQAVDMMNYDHETIKVTCDWEGRDTGVNS